MRTGEDRCGGVDGLGPLHPGSAYASRRAGFFAGYPGLKPWATIGLPLRGLECPQPHMSGNRTNPEAATAEAICGKSLSRGRVGVIWVKLLLIREIYL